MKRYDFIHKRLLLLFMLIFNIAWGSGSKQVSITQLFEKSSESSMALCASLSQYSYGSNTTKAKEYIKLTPNQHYTLSIDYDGICLNGLKPRTRYSFTINRGIPLKGYHLDRDYSFTKTTTDYSPSYSFRDGGYILPAKGEISIPIDSTNVKEFEISLYRINTKNLISKINDYGFIRSMYSYALNKIASTDGYLLWQKKIKIQSRPNQSVTTALPIGEYLKDRKPGVYILSASIIGEDGKAVDYYDPSIQWFMISDIGLYTLRADDGMTIYTREISTAKRYDDVKLELISKNNEILYSTISKDGVAHFPASSLSGKNGLKPKAIYAYGRDGDFSVIDLSRQPHDLSDRGVQGRNNPGKYDAFIYSNRGIFRPGESISVYMLVRNSLAEASPDMTLSLKIFDSQGKDVLSKMIKTDKLGEADIVVPISQSASRGRWHLKLYAGSSKPIGTLSFLVENFVPPKIKIDIDSEIERVAPNSNISLSGVVRYLNNTPLANATVETTTMLYQTKRPFKDYSSYHFGDTDSRFMNLFTDNSSYSTDSSGRFRVPINLGSIPEHTAPISAHITISASEPGGRPVERVLDIPIDDKDGFVGIKPLFENSSVDMESKALFGIVYLQHSKPIAKELKYRVIEEHVHWNWILQNGQWEYDKSYSDGEDVVKDTIFYTRDEPTPLELSKLDWGTYRLEILDSVTNEILSTYRFTSGYEESISKSSPDRLPISIDKQSYSIGDKVRVHITPKFSGPIVVSVANHTILDTKTINATLGQEQELEFTVDRSWGSSIYVIATAFRAQSKRLGANRAIGLAHLKVVDPKKIIEISLEYQTKVRSSQPTKIVVKAKGSSLTNPTYFTLAAVDDAVLRLTNYRVPDPKAYLFGQQKLGIEIRDIYADLIKTVGAHAKFNVGAGDMEEDALKQSIVSNKREVISIMSKPIALDSSGSAVVSLDVPDYQGSLKLMVVAWNKIAVGSQSGDMVVKDEISPEIYLPKFISVGDSAKSLITVDFDESVAKGEYEIRFTNENAEQRIASDSSRFVYDSNSSVRFSKVVEVKAPSLNDNTLRVEVIKDGDILVKKEWQLAVRSRYQQVYTRDIGLLKPNETIDIKRLIDSSLWSDIGDIRLKVSGKILLPTDSIASELVAYSGRCAEQTTSRAMPWLFLSESRAKELTINRQAIVQRAIERLLSYQRFDGGFGLWSSSPSSMWVSSYVLDFLTRAKELGYSVPDRNVKAGLDWLENNLDRWSSIGSRQEADSYALYVLARSGRILMSEILHRSKSKNSKIISAQAWGHLGVALSLVGEKRLAQEMFENGKRSLGRYARNGDYYSNYGGGLRDEASLVILMKEAALGLDWGSIYSDLALTAKDRRYLSTQEMSQLLRASYVANIKPTDLKLTVDGKVLQLPNGEYTVKAKDIDSIPSITNSSSGKVWFNTSFQATPVASIYSSKQDNGFTITKKIYNLEGELQDISHFRQNDRVVVILEGTIDSNHIQNPLVSDWLPAGFELENPNINGIDAISGLKWIDNLSDTDNLSYKDDRFEAAISMSSSTKGRFKVAYIARAVSRGSYTMPPAYVADMYQPRYRAMSRFQPSQITIDEKDTISNKVSRDSNNREGKFAKLSEDDYIGVNSKLITDLSGYSIVQLSFLRNSIFAHAGLDFEARNPMLHNLFSAYSWYHPREKNPSKVYMKLTQIQKENIKTLLDEEKRLGGGLALSDFYRVHNKLLRESDLSQYTKDQLYILRNSLFARRGVKFNNPRLREIFSHMPWYRPTDITSATIYDEIMSEQEKSNVTLMQKMERR
ncbi:PAN domain protein [hydrothermal vent metagenome]|uniref:PAN domain protein n=1 Tax=hydrothermal vent metagenome TaxID=652676 RepID=A0A1W1BE00_9ZZZZ